MALSKSTFFILFHCYAILIAGHDSDYMKLCNCITTKCFILAVSNDVLGECVKRWNVTQIVYEQWLKCMPNMKQYGIFCSMCRCRWIFCHHFILHIAKVVLYIYIPFVSLLLHHIFFTHTTCILSLYIYLCMMTNK